MDENLMEQTENMPQEVILRYKHEPEEVVHYFVQPTPMPGMRGEEQPLRETKKRSKKGLWIFLAIFSLILLSAAVALAVFWDDIVWSFSGVFSQDDYEIYNFEYSNGHVYDLPTMEEYAAGGASRIHYEPQGGAELTPSEVFERVSPSVVTIMAALDEQGAASVGTGVIFSEDGYIVTNFHVLSGCQDCMVALYTGETYDAGLVGYGTQEDLAVLKIEAEGLTPAEFGDSDTLRVGDTVYAIGNPLGVDLLATFTDGIVSALGRRMEEEVSVPLIQTNAALNSGNSGGPLINRFGQVVGINTMKLVKDYRNELTVEGLGFAIPISDCAYMVNDIVKTGEIGGELVLGITVLRAQVALPDGTSALEIESVDPDGPGEKAGLKAGDCLVSADGEKLEATTDLLRIRRRHERGETMELTVWREGEYLSFSVALEERK